MATIRKRNNVWNVQIRRKGYKAISCSFIDHSTAQAWARKTESELERGIYLDISLARSTTLSAVLTKYAQEILPSLRSYDSEIYRIKTLSNAIGNIRLSDLQSHHIANYRNDRLKQIQPASVKRELGLLSRILNIAIKEWAIPLPTGNPVSQITMPKEPYGRSRRLSEDEEVKLNTALTNTPTVKMIIAFALETAMRRQEITSMDWCNINLSNCTIHIPKTKTDTPRTIPLSRTAIAILKERREGSKNIKGAVWMIKPRSTSQAFRRACKRACIDNLRFHDLRHEATSRFFEKGLSVMEVATITGHKDLRMLRRYTHLRAEDIAIKLG